MNEIPFFNTRTAFAMRVGQLSSLLYEQIERCLVSRGLRLRGYTTSIVQTLHHAGPQSITELAESLELSHQLASQRVRWLVGEGFATIERGAQDRRRRIVTLTADGAAEAEKLQGFLPVIEAAYADLFDEIGLDAHRATLDVIAALADRPLELRCDP
ncbi:MAG: MarR family winged helix-turn-helix transcriptional regulator [Longimicrobiales bacterium]|jgi:DNA-binding MarR family transcriptional regulator